MTPRSSSVDSPRVAGRGGGSRNMAAIKVNIERKPPVYNSSKKSSSSLERPNKRSDSDTDNHRRKHKPDDNDSGTTRYKLNNKLINELLK